MLLFYFEVRRGRKQEVSQGSRVPEDKQDAHVTTVPHRSCMALAIQRARCCLLLNKAGNFSFLAAIEECLHITVGDKITGNAVLPPRRILQWNPRT